MKPYPLSPLNHFTVPCAILTSWLCMPRPAMAGAALATFGSASLSRNAPGTETGGTLTAAAALAAGPLGLHVDPSPADTSQDAELARLLAAGAHPADV